jgi:hypothetical protein
VRSLIARKEPTSTPLHRCLAAFALVSSFDVGCAVAPNDAESKAQSTAPLAPLSLHFDDPHLSSDGTTTISRVAIARAADGAVTASWRWSRDGRTLDASIVRGADGAVIADDGTRHRDARRRARRCAGQRRRRDDARDEGDAHVVRKVAPRLRRRDDLREPAGRVARVGRHPGERLRRAAALSA